MHCTSTGFALGMAFCLLLLAGVHQNVASTTDASGPRGCIVDCANSEEEPCGEQVNGGCCCEGPPAFSPLACGDIVCGNAWYDGSFRDTDWYEMVLTEPRAIRVSLTAEFAALLALVETDPPGSGDCADMTGLLDPYVMVEPCEAGVFEVTLPPGNWWIHVSPQFAMENYLCGTGPGPDGEWSYTLQVECLGACCLDVAPYCVVTWPSECAGTFLGAGSQCAETDCNYNGISDNCEIAAGLAEDCDGNEVPDDCDPDFDQDGLIDACDPDIDDDGVPNDSDVCDYTPLNLPPGMLEADGSVRGDLDGDCDVDLDDVTIMQARFTGPNRSH